MNKKNENSVLLVGAGLMAIEYLKVLKSLDTPTIVVGRGINSAKHFEKETSIYAHPGGIESWLKNNQSYPTTAIIAVTENKLGEVARLLIEHGFKRILLEKPGGLDYEDIQKVSETARKYNSEVIIGYNRRFYCSTQEAKKIIEQDGGVTSMTFEFTEWSHRLHDLEKAPGVKENWFLQNSTHVIDLAFYFGGIPKEISTYTADSLPWHPSAAVFTGAGITEKNVLFSYHANWKAPGRWWLEVNTSKNRLIFRPMEKLHITPLGSVAINEVDIDDSLDKSFKPGLYKQVEAFLNKNYDEFVDIHEQLRNMHYYNLILNGNNK